eukprot:COSAG05_NODE_16958_length_335_cov_0.644068_1_plen_90_part_10
MCRPARKIENRLTGQNAAVLACPLRAPSPTLPSSTQATLVCGAVLPFVLDTSALWRPSEQQPPLVWRMERVQVHGHWQSLVLQQLVGRLS